MDAAKVRTVLTQIPYCANHSLNDLQIESLPSLSNQVYKLTLAGECLVLRLPGSGSERYIDRAREQHNAAIASDLGLNAEVLYLDTQTGIQLSRFIEQSFALAPADLTDPERLNSAVMLLRRLHDCGQPFQGRMELFPQLDEYLRLSASIDDPLNRELRKRRAKTESLRDLFECQQEPLCPCHIDPTPANFLSVSQANHSSRLYLLDWEYSAMCEPLWDLAYLALEADFDTSQDERLLLAYYSSQAPIKQKRFQLYKVLLALVSAAWGMVRLGHETQATDDYRRFVRKRLRQSGPIRQLRPNR